MYIKVYATADLFPIRYPSHILESCRTVRLFRRQMWVTHEVDLSTKWYYYYYFVCTVMSVDGLKPKAMHTLNTTTTAIRKTASPPQYASEAIIFLFALTHGYRFPPTVAVVVFTLETCAPRRFVVLCYII